MFKVQFNHQRRTNQMGSRSADDFSDVAERIFHNLNVVFDRDDALDEFDIIPVESKSNRSPVIHTNHKLALESWCIPFLYTHSFKNFICLLPKNRFPSSSALRNSNSCSREVSSKLSTLSESERIARGLQLSRALILLNPDLTLAWNYRREIFNTSSKLKVLKAELQLVCLTASRKPKCPEGFTYRKWLVKRILESNLVPNLLEFYENESIAAETAAAKYFSNYHAWSYRLWFLEFILDNKDIVSKKEAQEIVDKELVKSNLWVEKHVSDYSGFHYRQKVLHHIGKLGTNQFIIDRLKQELEENQSMINLFPGHESLWYHRRGVMRHYIHKISRCDDIEENKERLVNTQEIEKHLVEAMQLQLKETNKDNISNKYSELDMMYSERHQRWLLQTFKWD